MNINQEIEKEEMKVQNLVKDWHPQKLASFIDDLIKKDRAEQLILHDVVLQSEQLKPKQQICYKSNEPCKYDCSGLCKESC